MKKNVLLVIILSVYASCSFGATQKIACVGNSITYGYGLSSAATQSYPSQLQTLLGTTNWQVGNFGVNSRTMLKKGDKPYWNESAYTNAKAYLPNYVMIELGTNDAKTNNWNPYGKEFVSNYKEMIQVFRNLSSKPDVYMGLIPPGENVGWNILFNYVKDSVNTRIKQIAIECGVNLIDIFDALNGNSANWFNTTLFQADGIHPKTAGAAIIAQKVKELMTMAKPQLVYSNAKITAPVAFGYQWYYNGSPVPEADGGNNAEFVPTKIGTYKVSLKLNANNETRIVSSDLVITELTSEVHNPANSGFKIYPNPAFDGTVYLEASGSDKFQITFFDISGKICLTEQSKFSTNPLNIGQLSTGTYLVKIQNSDFVYYTKFLKAI